MKNPPLTWLYSPTRLFDRLEELYQFIYIKVEKSYNWKSFQIKKVSSIMRKFSNKNHCTTLQTKMLVTCQRFGDLFLFGLVWQYSSVQTTYNQDSFHLGMSFQFPFHLPVLFYNEYYSKANILKSCWPINFQIISTTFQKFLIRSVT